MQRKDTIWGQKSACKLQIRAEVRYTFLFDFKLCVKVDPLFCQISKQPGNIFGETSYFVTDENNIAQ